MAEILLIDDDQDLCSSIADFIESMGHAATCVFRLDAGLDKVQSHRFDAIFLDIHLPDGNGLKALPKLRESSEAAEIIIITGEGDADGAEIAIRNGCWDYIQKPLSIGEIKLQITRVLQYQQEKGKTKAAIPLTLDGVIGNSSPMRACIDILAKSCRTDANVLITGETGTGKELFAKAIHDNSDRSDRVFVVVDCAALPETLVESTLFGYEKGAFTGADKPRDGLVLEADNGTLFLDEVGELPLHIQGAFLRVLQEHRFRPVGAKKEVKSEFRLVAATNRNLEEMVQKGEFRKDLLFRLRTFVIDMPPLRERKDDIRDIAFYYMNKFCDRFDMGTRGVSPEFLDVIAHYSWPGNVRELCNAMESALSMARDEHTLFPVHLPPSIRIQQARDSVAPKTPDRPIPKKPYYDKDSDSIPGFRDLIDSTEREYLQDLLAVTKSNIKEVCRISGLSRGHIYRLLKKHDIAKK